MKKKKVAYILTPVDFGGSERVSLNFLKHVDRGRFDIRPVVLIRPWEDEGGNIFLRELESEGYEAHKIPVAIRTKTHGRDYLRVVRCYRLIYSFLKKGSFDLVHTNGYFADTVGIPAARFLGIPSISTCHGFIRNDMKLLIYNMLDQFVLRMAGKTIAVSEAIKEDLIRHGVKEDRIEVITNAVNAPMNAREMKAVRLERRAVMNLSPKDFAVCYIGRLSAEKGLKHLITALSMIEAGAEHVKLVIIGDGPQKQELKELAEKHRVGERVVFAGFQSDVEAWIPAMDAFILPSLTEGTPMALLEAMAYGLPSIASAVGGVPDIIDSGVNGILVSPGRPDELKDALLRIIEDAPLRKKLSAAARKRIRADYDVKDWARKIEAEYDKLAGQT